MVAAAAAAAAAVTAATVAIFDDCETAQLADKDDCERVADDCEPVVND